MTVARGARHYGNLEAHGHNDQHDRDKPLCTNSV
jgi:hypothetical protein